MRSMTTSTPGTSVRVPSARRSRLRYVMLVAATATLISGCSSDRVESAGSQGPATTLSTGSVDGDAQVASTQAGSRPSGPTASITDLTRASTHNLIKPLWQRDNAFWSSMSFDGLEVEQYSDIQSMAESATAVVVGQVVGVVEGRELTDPESGDVVRYPVLRVEVLELVRGALPVGGSIIDLEAISRPQGDLAGPALLFLRWKGEGYEEGLVHAPPEVEAGDRLSYRLVSSQGIFIPGPNKEARNPLSEAMSGYLEDRPDVLADPVAREAIGLGWEDLVRSVAG